MPPPAGDLGRWEPCSVGEVVALFRDAPFRWWIGGGHALALHLGRDWRPHDDIDIGVVRADAPLVRDVLVGWDLRCAVRGQLHVWDGHPLDAARNENNVWCRESPDAPWRIDVTIGAGDDAAWAFRRDPRLRRPWPDAVLHTEAGVPYLAPELQLLFKSRDVRAKDDVDAREVMPALGPNRRAFLAEWLSAEHPWRALLF